MEKIKSEGQFMFEIFLPREMFDQLGLNDKEADVLYKMWKDSSPGSKKYSANNADSAAIVGLKTKGYVVGSGNELEFTEKGKKIIREMVTSEPNSFDKNSKSLSYSGIKNKSAKRQRQTFTKHADNAPKTEPFNLRKEAIKKMRGIE
jgi:hypothetical protein